MLKGLSSSCVLRSPFIPPRTELEKNGLFSAVVATLVSISVQDLRPNSQDTSAFYLEQMYKLQADSNVSRPIIPSAAAEPPAFSPPTYAVWVNTLWFLSLVISLTCAMLATSVQQWARRYLRMTQPPRCSPHKRARVRAFFANGVDKFRADWAVEGLPALVHLSLFIFFAGLVIYLCNINHTVFSAVVCWVGLLFAAYMCITLMPSFRHDSPYNSPLSSTAWFLCTVMLWAVNLVLNILIIPFGQEILERYGSSVGQFLDWFMEGVEGEAEGASRRSPVDGRILEWTVDALSEDDELEKFFEAIPGFYKSGKVMVLRRGHPGEAQQKILFRLHVFLRSTLSSTSLSESVKIRRLAVCLNAAGEVDTPNGVSNILDRILYENWRGIPHSIEIGHFLRSWEKTCDAQLTLGVRVITALIIANAQDRNDRWIALARDHLGVPEDVFQGYLARGDSVLLASLILTTRLFSRADRLPLSFYALQLLCKFNIHDTLPGLQHEFCALWNELVLEAQSSGPASGSVFLLAMICQLYITLHRGTDAAPTAFSGSTDALDDILDKPSSYPLCNIPGHRSDSAHHVHDLLVEEKSTHHPTTALITVRHSDSVQAPIPRSLQASYPDDPTPYPPDKSSHAPRAIVSPDPTPQVVPPNPVTPFEFVATTLPRITVDHPVISSTATFETHTTAATISMPQPIIPSSSRIISPRHTGSAGHLPLSPSIIPAVSLSSSPLPPPSNTLPANTQPRPTSSPSQSNQMPPSQRFSVP